jgi:GMP synthase-like glutamine amidotransferase
MKFILTTSKPVFGICMGLELMAVAFGGKVEKMPKKIEEYMDIKSTFKGRKLLKKKSVHQFEGHEWRVKSVPKKQFDVLAKSKIGIEMIRHKNRPLLATQFHPEMPGGTVKLTDLLSTF